MKIDLCRMKILIKCLQLNDCYSAICTGSQLTYIHIYITCIYTYVHTYIHTYIHAYIHTCIHTHILTYIHTYLHTYIHTYIRTYMHTYLHTCIHTYKQPNSEYLNTSIDQIFVPLNGQLHMYIASVIVLYLFI